MSSEMTCIICPNGCLLRAERQGWRIRVEGAGCKNGEAYARQELTDPRRSFTGSVRVEGGELPLVSVRSELPVKKARLLPIAESLKELRLTAPVEAGTAVWTEPEEGIRLLATRTVEKAEEHR